MIMGGWWRYSPLPTHDHERHTYGGYRRMPAPGGPPRAWCATWLCTLRFVDYEGMATMPSSQRRVPGHWCPVLSDPRSTMGTSVRSTCLEATMFGPVDDDEFFG